MRFLGLTRQLTLHGLWIGLLACSNSSEPVGAGGTGNTAVPGGGSSATGGGNGEGGSAAIGSGNEGNVPAAGTTGTEGGAPAGGRPSSGAGAPSRTFQPSGGRGPAFVTLRPPGGSGSVDVCAELSVVPTPQVPTVAIVLDNSSTMYEPQDMPPSAALLEALMNPDTGAIKPLEGKVRFGFTAYRSPKGMMHAEDDPACADISTVPYALNNYAAIDEMYRSVTADARGPKGCSASPDPWTCMSGWADWDTPTGHAITRVANELAAFTPDPPGRKYILLVTDGTPNTCRVFDPDCGQDLAIKAVQDAFALGIGTFVIGVGNIARGMSTCDPNAGRCGEDHLQDIANAGTGAPVAPPPQSYWYSQCATIQSGTNPGTPQATYAASEAEAGNAPYFTATTAAELREALSGLLNDVISCTVEMDAIVTGNPALGEVTVDSNPVSYGDPNGWILETNRYSVTLQGAACRAFKDGAKVDIKFPCDPNGNPIAVRR